MNENLDEDGFPSSAILKKPALSLNFIQHHFYIIFTLILNFQ